MRIGRITTLACFGFLVGTGVFSFGQWLDELWCFATGIAIGLIAIVVKKNKFRFICIILSSFFFAGWRYGLSYPVIDEQHISFFNGQVKIFQGEVFQEPVLRSKGWQLTVKTENGNVLVNTELWPAHYYGEVLEVTCRLEAPESEEFPYDRYLARFNIYSVCYRPTVAILSLDSGNPVYRFIFKVKRKAYKLAQANLPEPEASLVMPVVFGGGQDIAEDITDEFRRTGLTHIMAVSGFNVSLLTVMIGLGLYALGLRRRLVFYVTTVFITSYVIMVGAPASATRAGIMSLVLLLALTIGRLAKLGRTVLLVAVMTLVVNPRLLRDDIGWQLSFLALIGLMYLHPWLQKMAEKVTKGKGKWIVEALVATIAAQIATAPVIIYNFGQLSLISPLANLLVVWVVPLLTVMMIISLLLTALIPSLGLFFFFPNWLMVKYIFWIVQTLSKVGWAVWEG